MSSFPIASKLDTTRPPVALANASMSDFLALLMAIIPCLARKCCAKSSIPF